MINIRKGDFNFSAHFLWDDDIVYIMQKHRGRYDRQNSMWVFPMYKLEKVLSDLDSKNFQYRIINIKPRQTSLYEHGRRNTED